MIPKMCKQATKVGMDFHKMVVGELEVRTGINIISEQKY